MPGSLCRSANTVRFLSFVKFLAKAYQSFQASTIYRTGVTGQIQPVSRKFAGDCREKIMGAIRSLGVGEDSCLPLPIHSNRGERVGTLAASSTTMHGSDVFGGLAVNHVSFSLRIWVAAGLLSLFAYEPLL